MIETPPDPDAFPYSAEDFLAAYARTELQPAASTWACFPADSDGPAGCACPLGVMVLDRQGLDGIRAISRRRLNPKGQVMTSTEIVGALLGLSDIQVRWFTAAYDGGPNTYRRPKGRVSGLAFDAGLAVHVAIPPTRGSISKLEPTP